MIRTLRHAAFNRRCPTRPEGSCLWLHHGTLFPSFPAPRAAVGASPTPPPEPAAARPGGGGDAAPSGSSAALRAYLAPGAKDLPRPRLHAPEQRVPDHAQHVVAVAIGTHRRRIRAAGERENAGGRLAGQRGSGAGPARAPPTEMALARTGRGRAGPRPQTLLSGAGHARRRDAVGGATGRAAASIASRPVTSRLES